MVHGISVSTIVASYSSIVCEFASFSCALKLYFPLKIKAFRQTSVGKLRVNLAAVHGAIQLAMKLEHKFELTVY